MIGVANMRPVREIRCGVINPGVRSYQRRRASEGLQAYTGLSFLGNELLPLMRGARVRMQDATWLLNAWLCLTQVLQALAAAGQQAATGEQAPGLHPAVFLKEPP